MVYKSLRRSRAFLTVALVASAALTVLAQAPQTPATRVPTGQAPPTQPAAAKPTAEQLRTEAEQAYAKRLTQDKLDGHYIPVDILDAMRELDKITSTASQAAYASKPEDFVVKRLYFSFGRWLGVNWGLYDGSRLSAHMRAMGVDQPDGQIEMLMRLYHRHLSGKDLSVKPLADAYKAQKAREEEARMSRGTVIDSFTRPAPAGAAGNPPRG